MKVVNMGALFKISLTPFFTQIPPEIIIYGNQFISSKMKTYAMDDRQLKFQFNLSKWELEERSSPPRDIKVKNMRLGPYFQVQAYY
jgi:hypothetical protein